MAKVVCLLVASGLLFLTSLEPVGSDKEKWGMDMVKVVLLAGILMSI